MRTLINTKNQLVVAIHNDPDFREHYDLESYTFKILHKCNTFKDLSLLLRGVMPHTEITKYIDKFCNFALIDYNTPLRTRAAIQLLGFTDDYEEFLNTLGINGIDITGCFLPLTDKLPTTFTPVSYFIYLCNGRVFIMSRDEYITEMESIAAHA